MKKEYGRNIFFLGFLTALFLLSGIWAGFAEANPVLSCHRVLPRQIEILHAQEIVFHQNAVSEETADNQTQRFLSGMGRTLHRGIPCKIDYFMFHSAFLPGISTQIRTAIFLQCLPEYMQQNTIISHIHQTDGKKRTFITEVE